MKGIVFNLLEEIVQAQYGEATWDLLLEKARLNGVYTSLGNYPDAELGSLVAAASDALGISPADVLRWVGSEALPRLAARYPQFFTAHANTRSFVLTLNDIIHPEVRKLYPGANAPDFEFDTSSEQVLVMTYRSERKLCAFAQGLVEGAAVYFGETATFEQSCCMLRGDDVCTFRIEFAQATRTELLAA